ncbi:hypothetical protein J3P75_13815 [Pseudomonas sp. R1-1]|uniref:hypothetical protein n=1 Tax=Pseudomonas sp. R1-1 TaxID=1602529 RepID=UPI003DA7DC3F
MADPFTEAEKPTPLARKPTEYLTRVSIENLSPLGVFLLAKEGFALSDVYSMVSLSELYLSWNVIKRIVGKPSRTMQGKNDKTTTGRLGVFESAIAFQYAKPATAEI